MPMPTQAKILLKWAHTSPALPISAEIVLHQNYHHEINVDQAYDEFKAICSNVVQLEGPEVMLGQQIINRMTQAGYVVQHVDLWLGERGTRVSQHGRGGDGE